jgi:hypothetical protein
MSNEVTLNFTDTTVTLKSIGGSSAADVTSAFAAHNADEGAHANITSFVSIEAYGASTALADNASAIQAALDAAGGVFVPEGTYTFLSTITLNDRQSIIGSGRNSALKFMPTIPGDVGIYATDKTNIILQDFTIKGGNLNSAIALQLSNVTDSVVSIAIDGAWINGGNPAYSFSDCAINVTSVAPSNSFDVSIENIYINAIIGDGLQITGNSGNIVSVRGGVIGGLDGWCIDCDQGTEEPIITLESVVVQGGYLGLLRARMLASSAIRNCHFEATPGNTTPPIQLIGAGTTSAMIIDGNNISQAAADYAIDFAFTAGASAIRIKNNRFTGTSGKKAVHFGYTGAGIEFGPNYYNGYGSTNPETLCDLGTYYVNDALLIDSGTGGGRIVYLNGISNDPPATIIDVRGKIKAFSHGGATYTAAPSAGDWSRGDMVLNSNATSGQPMGWMCTVAGTPGTWVAMANLA